MCCLVIAVNCCATSQLSPLLGPLGTYSQYFFKCLAYAKKLCGQPKQICLFDVLSVRVLRELIMSNKLNMPNEKDKYT